jgi:hypothetical protein
MNPFGKKHTEPTYPPATGTATGASGYPTTGTHTTTGVHETTTSTHTSAHTGEKEHKGPSRVIHGMMDKLKPGHHGRKLKVKKGKIKH